MTGEIRRILSFEPARAKNNPVIILAVVSAALYFIVIGIYLGRAADEINGAFSEFRQVAEVGFQESDVPIIGWLRDATDPALQALFVGHSPLLAIFFWLALLGAPWLVMLVASDQTASELSKRHIRFILPRVTRRGLFMARLLSSWIVWAAISSISLFLVGIVLMQIGDGENSDSDYILMFRMIWILAIYGIPFIALMAFINTFISNAFLSYLLATGSWSIFWVLGEVGSWVHGGFRFFSYLIPTAVKYPLLSEDPQRFLTGVGGVAGYSLVFIFFGVLIFSRRDV